MLDKIKALFDADHGKQVPSYSDVPAWTGGWLVNPSSSAGVVVGEDDLMSIDDVFACVQLVSEDLASTPIRVLELVNGRYVPTESHPANFLLNVQSNDEMTAFDWRVACQASRMIRGNAYAQVRRNKLGELYDIRRIPNGAVTPHRDSRRHFVYSVSRATGSPIKLLPRQVIHVKGVSETGLIGMSISDFLLDLFGASKATEQLASELFANGIMPSAVLEWSGAADLKPESKASVQDQLDEKHRGQGKRRKVPILPRGFKYTPVALTAEEGQFLETRKFQRTKIAGLFRVPPHKLGDLDRATFSNIEEQNRDYVENCLNVHATNWEHRLNMCMFTPEENPPGQRPRFKLEFDFSHRLRANTKDRAEMYSKLFQVGGITSDEIREREGRPPSGFPNANKPHRQGATIPIDSEAKSIQSASDEPDNEDE